jgi:hypothetical protein
MEWPSREAVALVHDVQLHRPRGHPLDALRAESSEAIIRT